MQYLLQISHLSCPVQRLPGYQAPWSVLLRNRMAECFASVSEDELFSVKDFSILMYTLFRQRFYYQLYFKIFK